MRSMARPLAVAVGVIVFGLLVWPGLYVISLDGTRITNRVTGVMWYASPSGWSRIAAELFDACEQQQRAG